ncbi:MAG: SRPBCC domain-containing protein [Bacteroidetes bacterium]|nr:SRPBCC domain-containing protein [Bacteroidota bacterium]
MAEKNSSFRQEDNELIYTKLLDAPRELVWEVWTKAEHLKEWWGPEGFTLTHKSLKLAPGSKWQFIMHGMGQDWDNQIEYTEVVKPSLLAYRHSNPANEDMSFTVRVIFETVNGKTLLTMRSIFKSKEIIEQLNRMVNAIESGKQTLNKLEAYINAQITIRKQLKTKNMARVSTYLNFPGNTEKAFIFYKSVFGSEFQGDGIKRFGDIPPADGMPALQEADKKLILHVELPILGGHILMGTDAPESMGFNISFGNNVHINLEPDTREETKRLFDALSAGGKVTMELQDMFWGAYYGSCTDKFGVQWMFNCIA